MIVQSSCARCKRLHVYLTLNSNDFHLCKYSFLWSTSHMNTYCLDWCWTSEWLASASACNTWNKFLFLYFCACVVHFIWEHYANIYLVNIAIQAARNCTLSLDFKSVIWFTALSSTFSCDHIVCSKLRSNQLPMLCWHNFDHCAQLSC